MAAATSAYPSRDGNVLQNGGSSGAPSTCSSSSGFGFGIPTANGSEDHCNVALAGLFQQIMNDMKGSSIAWEDFLTKSTRLHATLKATLVASSAFLDAFQRVADVATNARGATKEIGKCLTRMVLRQRSIEAKMKTFTSALMDCLVTPLQEKMEDWKKTCLYMDKEHAKEYKKCRQDIKKRSTDTIRLQKKAKKGKSGSIPPGTNWGTVKPGMFTGGGSSKAMEAWNDLVEMKRQLQDKEHEAVRQAMIEERSRFCLFVSCLKPFLDEELSMLSEMVHLEEITDSLMQHSADPFQLPPASVQALMDVKATCSSTVSATDILLQDHLANDTYYSSSCSSGSNPWGNYMSPPDSPLEEEPSSPRSSNQDPSRHGSICSISNASTSSYASSDISSCSYGQNNGVYGQSSGKTLSNVRPYRRCFSDNNGSSEQHYYPSSIASSIIENDVESDGEETGLNDTLVGNGSGQRRKSRPRRSSVSHSEDLQQHHTMSLAAMRNEYYSTIRFSSISSGDSGFISHPDQVSGGNSMETSQESNQDHLLTPTSNGAKRGDGTWSGPHPISSSSSEKGVARRPPIPPFGSVLRGERLDAEGKERPHTIAYNTGNSMTRDDSTSRQMGRNPKRPPLTQDTFLPPPPGSGQHSSQTVAPKDFRRTSHVDTPCASQPDGYEAVYANSNLLNDTSFLPPPPDHWMDQNVSPAQRKQAAATGDRGVAEMNQVTVSMTIRRVKEKPSEFPAMPNCDPAQTEAIRKRLAEERQLRRHSQQIYGPPSTLSKPPPPPPIRRTPSLHQSISDADADMSLMGSSYEHLPSLKLQDQFPQRSHSIQASESHVNMINSLQERLRQSAKAPPGFPPKPAEMPKSSRMVNGTNAAPSNGPNQRDARSGVFSDIRNGAFRLRKVNPDECRDRSSPHIRRN